MNDEHCIRDVMHQSDQHSADDLAVSEEKLTPENNTNEGGGNQLLADGHSRGGYLNMEMG
ncbi:MAG: hypothetical protein ABW168_27525 [Sedimenticola sp.]